MCARSIRERPAIRCRRTKRRCEMKGSYEKSALLALGVIMVVLWLDFRSLR